MSQNVGNFFPSPFHLIEWVHVKREVNSLYYFVCRVTVWSKGDVHESRDINNAPPPQLLLVGTYRESTEVSATPANIMKDDAPIF